MRGKKYPVSIKTKGSVMAAAKARKSGGKVDCDDEGVHKAKEVGSVPGAANIGRADKASRKK